MLALAFVSVCMDSCACAVAFLSVCMVSCQLALVFLSVCMDSYVLRLGSQWWYGLLPVFALAFLNALWTLALAAFHSQYGQICLRL